MRYFTFLLLVFMYSFTFSQDNVSRVLLEIQNYQDEKQERISDFLSKNEDFDRSKTNQIWDVINGKPILIESDNSTASISTRTNHLQPDGSLNLNLTGENMLLGIWEFGGIPQVSHPEFEDDNGESRLQIIDNINASFHATHVAGTMIARGLNPDAQGMAIKASLLAYDHIDDAQESFIASNDENLLISNHSYGVPVSNIVGADAEWIIGAYLQDTRLWDIVTYNSPYFLPVFSAGNDGFVEYEGGIATRFDKLTGGKVSKNTLVVANSSQAGIIAETGEFLFAFINPTSSQGPTDDGRIKPDITGYGTNVFSTAPGGIYGFATGTSMSAPNISGSALLLQELYFETYDTYMLSQTLKGLISVTADDVAEEGPDQTSGWGLMNSKRAAEAILDSGINDIILESTLISGETNTIRINYTSDEPLKVALAWTDPAGEVAPSNVFNDPTPKLQHDLDLRLINTNTNLESFPWKLDQNDLTAPAIIGDNIVDNIEIIELDQPGVYDVVVSNKGDLITESQSYSLIVLNAEEVPLSFESFNKTSLQLWPNPARNKLNISAVHNFKANVEVNIVDMLGRNVYTNNYQSTNNLSVDVSSLSKGIYIVELNDGETSIKNKFLKE